MVSTAINMPTNTLNDRRGTSNDVRASIHWIYRRIKIALTQRMELPLSGFRYIGGANCVNFWQNCINCTVTYLLCYIGHKSWNLETAGLRRTETRFPDVTYTAASVIVFSVGDGSGWTLEYNNFHDTTGDSGTDGIAFHDSNAFKNIVRYNVIKNIAPGVGKAGISVGSTGVLVTGGSWSKHRKHDRQLRDSEGSRVCLLAAQATIQRSIGRVQ